MNTGTNQNCTEPNSSVRKPPYKVHHPETSAK